MRRSLGIFFAASFAASIVFAASILTGCASRGPSIPAPAPGLTDLPTRSLTPPIFYVDTTPFVGAGSSAGVRVTISVPLNQLQWAKRADGGYEASFDVVAVFYDRKHRQRGGDIWRHQVTATEYKETISQKKTFTTTKEFVLPPGEYILEVRLSSVGVDSGSTAARRVVIAPAVVQPLALSGLEIGTCADSLALPATPETAGFTPSLTRRFGDPLPWVCARGEVIMQGGRAGEQMELRLRIVGAKDHLEADQSFPLAAQGERTRYAVSVPARPLGPGVYKLQLEAIHAGDHASAERAFEIDASRIDIERNYDDYVELARYYLGDDQVEPLRHVPEAERRTAWADFWKKLDPDPDTPENERLEEFLSRVRTAAERYAARGEPGWRTDRGKVYIRYGEPDDVEQVPQGFNSPAYEIWRYVSRNLTFVFADASGFGEYVLVQPAGGIF